jgi:hypothetical protein
MKRQYKIIALVLLGTISLRADFFGVDIPFLEQLVQQGIQRYRQAEDLYRTQEQARQNMENMANFFTSPGAWKNAIRSGAQYVQYRTTGTNPVTDIQSLNASLQASTQAIQAANESGQVSTGNAAAISSLELQQAQAAIERDRMQSRLNYETQVQQFAQSDGYSYTR